MYSPKIAPTLIPRLYQLAKARAIPMTRLVNQLIEDSLLRLERDAGHVSEPPAKSYRRKQKERNNEPST